MNTAEYLQEIINSKSDIKAALRERGINVSGGFKSIPPFMNRLFETRSMTLEEGMYIGQGNLDGILLNAGDTTSLAGLFKDNTDIITIRIQMEKVKNMSQMFMGCKNLQTIYVFGKVAGNLDMTDMFDGAGTGPAGSRGVVYVTGNRDIGDDWTQEDEDNLDAFVLAVRNRGWEIKYMGYDE